MPGSVLITGMNGTLAPVLAERFRQQGLEVHSWDRSQVAPDDESACREYIADLDPEYLCHLAMGDTRWAALLARSTAQLNIPMLFTSTAMVFDHQPDGPHGVEHARTAKDEYGKGKIACEDVIRQSNPDALIVRIGWQCDWEIQGNNMFHALKEMHKAQGKIQASHLWIPATSMMKDTCDAMLSLLETRQSGVFQLDSNRYDALNFAQIVCAISNKFQLGWHIEVTEDYCHDQRLPDKRVKIPNISSHL